MNTHSVIQIAGIMYIVENTYVQSSDTVMYQGTFDGCKNYVAMFDAGYFN